MSDLKKTIDIEMVKAANSRDKLRLATIRMVKSSIKNKEIDTKKELSDQDIIKIMATMIKQRNESIRLFKEGGRNELADKEALEIEILQGFLPPPMSKEEIIAAAGEIINNVGASGLKDLGKVMKEIAHVTSGRALGKEVSQIVKDLLATAN